MKRSALRSCMHSGRMRVRERRRADLSPSAVRIVVPFAAGGAVDSVARVVGQKMSESSASRSSSRTGRARAAIWPPMRRPRRARWLYDLADHQWPCDQPVALSRAALRCDQRLRSGDAAYRSPLLLVASNNLQADSLKALIALAKEKPGTLNYGSTGVGTRSIFRWRC